MYLDGGLPPCHNVVISTVIFLLLSLVTGILPWHFSWTNGNPPPLGHQVVSDCSPFRITCDVLNTAVFCSASTERFPGTASTFFLEHFVAIPVAPIITGTILHFWFHIRCISIYKLLYFSFFFTFLCTFLSAGIATSISMHIFYYYHHHCWCCCCCCCVLLLLAGGEARLQSRVVASNEPFVHSPDDK